MEIKLFFKKLFHYRKWRRLNYLTDKDIKEMPPEEIGERFKLFDFFYK